MQTAPVQRRGEAQTLYTVTVSCSRAAFASQGQPRVIRITFGAHIYSKGLAPLARSVAGRWPGKRVLQRGELGVHGQPAAGKMGLMAVPRPHDTSFLGEEG